MHHDIYRSLDLPVLMGLLPCIKK